MDYVGGPGVWPRRLLIFNEGSGLAEQLNELGSVVVDPIARGDNAFDGIEDRSVDIGAAL